MVQPALCTLARLTTREQFDQLEPEWDQLFERACGPDHVFQTFSWLWHWANHYLTDRMELSIITGRVNDQLVMVWPLVVDKSHGLRKLSWMGQPVGQYGNIIVENCPDRDAFIAQAWNHIISLPVDVVFLKNVREDSYISPFLKRMNATLLVSSHTYYADFTNTITSANYLKRYSSKYLSNYRRYMRHLADCGTISFEQHRDGNDARHLCYKAIDTKKKWLKSRNKTSADLEDPRFAEFFADVAAGSDHPCGIRVSAVLCNGSPIAMEISLECKNQAFGHLLTYDIDYAKHGLGIVMADYAIRTTFEQGLKRFDLLLSDDSYKARWSDGVAKVDNWLYPLSLRGHVYVYLRQARNYLKGIIQPIFPAFADYLAHR